MFLPRNSHWRHREGIVIFAKDWNGFPVSDIYKASEKDNDKTGLDVRAIYPHDWIISENRFSARKQFSWVEHHHYLKALCIRIGRAIIRSKWFTLREAHTDSTDNSAIYWKNIFYGKDKLHIICRYIQIFKSVARARIIGCLCSNNVSKNLYVATNDM